MNLWVTKTAESPLVTKVAKVKIVATSVIGAKDRARYQVDTYPNKRKVVRVVKANWLGSSENNNWPLPRITVAAIRTSEPRPILEAVTISGSMRLKAILAMTFSIAQRIVAAKIINSGWLKAKPLKPPTTRLAQKTVPMAKTWTKDNLSFKSGIAKIATQITRDL